MNSIEVRRSIQIDDSEFPLRVRMSRKARRLSLRVAHDGITCTVPHILFLTETELRSIIRSKSDWIKRSYAKVSAHRVTFQDGTRLPFCGKEITLKIPNGSGSRVRRVVLRGADLEVSGHSLTNTELRDIISKWYRREAKRIIPLMVAEEAKRTNVRYSAITVRDQRGRWGSCSSRGSLSLNWRLILLPVNVANYLICHELAHLIEMNHSKRFWRIVERMHPEFRSAEKWLKNHGASMFW